MPAIQGVFNKYLWRERMTSSRGITNEWINTSFYVEISNLGKLKQGKGFESIWGHGGVVF